MPEVVVPCELEATTAPRTAKQRADGNDLSSSIADTMRRLTPDRPRPAGRSIPISGVLMSIRSSGPAQSRRSGLVEQHPLACFLVLTYLAAWCLWAPLVIFRDALPPTVGFILVLLGSLVPSTVAIILVALIHSKAGVRRLLSRLVKWRVGLRWYLVVLILPLLAPLGNRLEHPARRPRPNSRLLRHRRARSCSSSRSSQAVRLVKRSVGEASHCPIPRTITGL